MVAFFTIDNLHEHRHTRKSNQSTQPGPPDHHCSCDLIVEQLSEQLLALRATCRAPRATRAWSRRVRPSGTCLPLLMRAGRIAEVCCTVFAARGTPRATTKRIAFAHSSVWRLAFQRGRGRNRTRESASSSSSWDPLLDSLQPARRRKSRARAPLARG